MAVATRRVLPRNAAEVKDQFKDIGQRVARDSLNIGDRGDEVADLQKRLRAFGVYSGKADGVFNAKTEDAVRRFQQGAGIIVDGVAGPQTLKAMKDHTSFVQDDFRTTAHRNERGNDILRAERMLKDQGYNPGAVDGFYDRATADAVKKFTQAHGELRDRTSLDGTTFDALKAQHGQPLQDGSHSQSVRVLEQNLKELGFNPGAVDTDFTRETKNAVRKFQKQNNLDPSGIADVKTRAAIQKAVDDKPLTPKEQIAEWSKTPPKADYTRKTVNSSGDVLNQRTIEMMRRAEYIMQNKFGHKDFRFTVVQGSYSGAVSASGGTHDRGGAIDIHTRSYSQSTVDDMVKSLRMAGFASWSRGRGRDNFDPHIHAIAIGDRELSSSAAAQVQEYFNGGDGLVGSAPDPDRNLGRKFPEWARRFNH